MSGEIQGDASLDVQQVLAGLRQLQSSIAGVTNGMTRLNTEGDRTKRTLKDTFKDSAQAAGKMGGQVGSWTGKLLGGASMGDAFGRVAVGLSVLTLGFRAYEAVAQRAIEKTQAMISAQRALKAASEEARKEIEAQSRRGEAQAGVLVPLVAAGGKNAMDDLSMVTGTGVDQGSAAKGIASLYGRFGDSGRAKKGVDIAMRGEMGGLQFDQVAEALTKLGPAIENNGAVDRMLGRMSQKQTGRVGDPAEIWRERMKNIDGDSFIKKAREQQVIRSKIPESERETFMSSDLAKSDLSKALGPESSALLNAFSKHTEAVEELKKLAETQGRVWAIYANRFGGPGSYARQAGDLQEAFAEGQGLSAPPVKPADNLTKKTYGFTGATFSER